MSASAWGVGDVVQIDPAHDQRFGGCFMVITEPKAWGAQGYVSIPGKTGVAYYRCPSEAMHFIGIAAFVVDSGDDDDASAPPPQSAVDAPSSLPVPRPGGREP